MYYSDMVRELTERDLSLLSLVAPEFSGEECSSSGTKYRSILPPLANHYATDAEDFKERISRLTPEDIRYLINLIQSGEESLHCLSPEFFDVLYDHILMVAGPGEARSVAARYAMDHE